MHQAESSQNDDKAKCIEDCINGHSVHSARIFFFVFEGKSAFTVFVWAWEREIDTVYERVCECVCVCVGGAFVGAAFCRVSVLTSFIWIIYKLIYFRSFSFGSARFLETKRLIASTILVLSRWRIYTTVPRECSVFILWMSVLFHV